jgi:hypothetical protein
MQTRLPTFVKAIFTIAVMALPSIALADIPGVTIENDTISWANTGGWMQVQDARTYRTLDGCEGFITTCRSGEGEFNILDHTNDNRENGVLVVVNPQGSLIRQVRNDCTFAAGDIPDYASCVVQCPVSTRLIGVVECSARLRQGDRFFTVAAGFNGGAIDNSSTWRAANCQANLNDDERFGDAGLLISVGAICSYVE